MKRKFSTTVSTFEDEIRNCAAISMMNSDSFGFNNADLTTAGIAGARNDNDSSSSFWQRKCSILEEELEIRKISQNNLELQLKHERNYFEQERLELREKIQAMSSTTTNTTATNTNANASNIPDYTMSSSTKASSTHDAQERERIIEQQEEQIQKLKELLKLEKEKKGADKKREKKKKDEIISLRSRHLVLVREVHEWKQKAFNLQQQLVGAKDLEREQDQEHSSKDLIVIDVDSDSDNDSLSSAVADNTNDDNYNQSKKPTANSANNNNNNTANDSNTKNAVTAKETAQGQVHHEETAQGQLHRKETAQGQLHHGLAKAPFGAIKFDGTKWIYSSVDKYPKRTCKHPLCTKKIRTYCNCSKGYWRCAEHVEFHIKEDVVCNNAVVQNNHCPEVVIASTPTTITLQR